MNFISIGDVCHLLGISLSTAYRWIKLGKLKESFRTIGNHRRFNLLDIKHQFINTVQTLFRKKVLQLLMLEFHHMTKNKI